MMLSIVQLRIQRIVQVICLICFVAGAPAGSASDSMLALSGRTMGTTYNVKCWRNDAPQSSGASRAKIEEDIERLLHRMDQQMSTYLPDSELSQFNRATDTNWVAISSDVVEVIRRASQIADESDGALDITVGPLVNLWGFGSEKRPWGIPADSEIAKALPNIGYRKLSWRAHPPAIRKESPGVQCDLSAIAKGFAVDRISEYLESVQFNDYLVEIGGEVRANGFNANGAIWRVGVRDPGAPDEIRTAIALRNSAMATSGDYVQSFEQDGRRYSHTIDPRTGRPVAHALGSVTVVHESCAMADGWATALNVLGPEIGYKKASERRLAVLMIVRDGNRWIERMTPAFKERMANAP